MKLTEIPSTNSVTKEYLLEAFDDGMRFNFQVYNGKIEHVNDFEIFGWAKGKTMEEVVEWTEKKEKEHVEEKARWVKWKKELPSIMQQRQLLWDEEDRKIRAWEAEHYTEGEKGEGWFAP